MKTDATSNMKNFLSKHIAISVCALFLGGPLLADATPKQVFVLSSGERAILENNVLRIDGHNGSRSFAPAGTYQTRDGHRITVDSQGRASIGR